ncbi:hypothetical protein M569_00526, partial [Genlisea aurea]
KTGSVVPMDPTSPLKKREGSWILMDSSGQEVTLDVDKYAIMHRVQIHARDLRILDPQLSYPSAILGRKKAIVVNLEHIKAIITPREVLIRDPSDEDVLPVVKDLRRRLGNSWDSEAQTTPEPDTETGKGRYFNFPFEFRALEVALEAICAFLLARTTELEAAVYPALDMLTSKVSSRNLDRVRKLKSQMTRLTARVQKLRDELEQLLDDDNDLADLYLSRKPEVVAAGSPPQSVVSRASKAGRASVGLYENEVEELEMLVEAYFMQMDGTLNKLSMLREYIDSTEGYINIQLENRRNQLIQLELFLNSANLCLAFFSLVTGIFGVNIPYTWNNGYGGMFKWVLITTGALSIFFFMAIIYYGRCRGLIGS